MSEMLVKLWDNGLLQMGVWETIYMTLLSTGFAYLFGLPMGVILWVTDKNGLPQVGKGKQTACRIINCVLGFVVNFFRSIPCIILMVAIMPFTKLVVGTKIGVRGAVVPLVVSAAPFIARMVETSLAEVDAGVVEAAQSMGASTFQIIRKVYLPEAKPSLVLGGAISIVTILGYTAIAGTVGAGGLGDIAVRYGHQRFITSVMWVTVVILIILVQVVQSLADDGPVLSRHGHHVGHRAHGGQVPILPEHGPGFLRSRHRHGQL